MNTSRYISAAAIALASVVVLLGLTREVQAVAAAWVTVTNTTANPVAVTPVDNAVLNPFGQRVFPNVRQPDTITVPAGKKLVITGVSGFNNSNGSAYALEIGVTSNGQSSALAIPFNTTPSGYWRYLSTQPVFMVADPGTTVNFFIDDSDHNDFAGVNIDVRGYYVPI